MATGVVAGGNRAPMLEPEPAAGVPQPHILRGYSRMYVFTAGCHAPSAHWVSDLAIIQPEAGVEKLAFEPPAYGVVRP